MCKIYTSRSTLRKGLSLLLIAVIIWFIFSLQGKKNTQTNAKKEGITIVTELAPNNFYIQDDGTFGGIQPEIATLLFPDESLHWTPVTTREEALTALREGRADIYAASVPLSSGSEYEGTVQTDPIYPTRFVLLYGSGNNWMEDFSDSQKQTVIYGSTDDPSVAQIVEHISELSYPTIQYKALDKPAQEVAMDLYRGKIKYALVERKLAHKVVEVTEDALKYSSDLTFGTSQVWLIRADADTLLSLVNHRIEAILGTEAYNEVIKRNLGK